MSETKSIPSLAEALRGVSEAQFWAVKNETPHYSRAFAGVVKLLFADCKSAADLIEAISKGDRINISSAQRAIFNEAVRRKGPAKPAKAAKPAAKKPAPKKDPITGEAVKSKKKKPAVKSKLL